MDACKICGGDGKIASETCFNCEGSRLPIETNEAGNRSFNWREPEPNEFNLVAHCKVIDPRFLDDMKSMTKDGKFLELTQETKEKYLQEIKNGKVREIEADIISDCLENAKREVVEMLASNYRVVLKVEERGYSGWGLKE